MEKLIDELKDEGERLRVLIEGHKDFIRLDLSGPASAEVHARLATTAKRKALVVAAVLALESLVSDGYPGMESQVISSDAFDELKGSIEGMEKVLVDEFVERPLTTRVEVVVGVNEGAR